MHARSLGVSFGSCCCNLWFITLHLVLGFIASCEYDWHVHLRHMLLHNACQHIQDTCLFVATTCSTCWPSRACLLFHANAVSCPFNMTPFPTQNVSIMLRLVDALPSMSVLLLNKYLLWHTLLFATQGLRASTLSAL